MNSSSIDDALPGLFVLKKGLVCFMVSCRDDFFIVSLVSFVRLVLFFLGHQCLEMGKLTGVVKECGAIVCLLSSDVMPPSAPFFFYGRNTDDPSTFLYWY